jgi:uncharacterized protein YhbP (UPF0306 family)
MHGDRRTAALDFLRSHSVMTLATSGPDGPASSAVFYVNRGLELYFLSAPKTLHCRNLESDPRVAVTIQEDVKDWSAIRGLQLLAHAERLEGAQRGEAQRLYAQKFPDIFLARGVPASIAAALERIGWYRLAVRELRFIDNSVAFGHSDEWTAAQFLAPP